MLNKKYNSKLLNVTTIAVLALALNVTWVFWDFWRTPDWVNPASNPGEFTFWYGYGDLWFGYWYGYWVESWSLVWYYSDGWSNLNGWDFEIFDWEDLGSVSKIDWSPTSANSVTIMSSTRFAASASWIAITFPEWTIITNANWWTLNAIAIATWELPVTWLNLWEDEEALSAINFWVSGVKLNFSKPIKIEIPVPNTYTWTTIKVKVKHYWDSTYNTTWLTNSAWAVCSNWEATPASNEAVVNSHIATIYTCSASDFVTYEETSSSPSSW
jgi:hypothetical protein